MTRPGLISHSSSGERPQRSRVPLRKFSTRTSAVAIRSRAIFWPSSRRRLQVTDFLLRPRTDHHSALPLVRSMPHTRSGSPWFGGSSLMTSAPKSANSWPANGPASSDPISTTRRSESGPGWPSLSRTVSAVIEGSPRTWVCAACGGTRWSAAAELGEVRGREVLDADDAGVREEVERLLGALDAGARQAPGRTGSGEVEAEHRGAVDLDAAGAHLAGDLQAARLVAGEHVALEAERRAVGDRDGLGVGAEGVDR